MFCICGWLNTEKRFIQRMCLSECQQCQRKTQYLMIQAYMVTITAHIYIVHLYGYCSLCEYNDKKTFNTSKCHHRFMIVIKSNLLYFKRPPNSILNLPAVGAVATASWFIMLDFPNIIRIQALYVHIKKKIVLCGRWLHPIFHSKPQYLFFFINIYMHSILIRVRVYRYVYIIKAKACLLNNCSIYQKKCVQL